MKLKKSEILLKGTIVGGTMLVPGVSGGSMAMILGVYEKLVSSVSSFEKHKKESLLFLGIFAMGGLIGIILFARPLLTLIEQYPMPMIYFFLGAVAGSIPLILKQAEVRTYHWKVPLNILIGLFVVLLFSIIPANIFQFQVQGGTLSFATLMLAGFVAAVALVLPGISVSYLLLLMGLYDETVKAISEFYLPFLIPLGVGLILGIVLTTKILESAITNYPQPTYLIILGFILGSIIEIFPGIPSGRVQFLCLITLMLGFGSICLLSWKELKIQLF